MSASKTGKLYLIPTLLGDTLPEKVLPEGTLNIIRSLDYFIVEQIRTSRRFLVKAGLTKPIDSISFVELNKHSKIDDLLTFLHPALEGKNIGLMSEAGTPCIADPGSFVVDAAHQSGIHVVPLSGPSSIILALMASGFNGQQFMFHGYLPIPTNERSRMIRQIESQSRESGQTQIFIETPYRNRQMLESLLKTCHSATMLCVATNISMEDESVISLPVHKWEGKIPEFDKKPAVFLLLVKPRN